MRLHISAVLTTHIIKRMAHTTERTIRLSIRRAHQLQFPTFNGVLILQFSMPVAVFNYLLALRYQREPGEVAGIVVLSTLLAFLQLAVIVSYVLV